MSKLKFLYSISLAFLLLALSVSAIDERSTNSIIIGIDVLGVTVGLIMIMSITTTLKSVGGIVGTSYKYMLNGIGFQLLALMYTLIFVRFKLFPTPAGVDIHHLLMIIGIVFFAIAAYKLRLISQNPDNKAHR